MKILSLVRHNILLMLVLTSVPLIVHFFKDKPHNDWVVHLHILLGILFVIFAVTGTILNKKAKKK